MIWRPFNNGGGHLTGPDSSSRLWLFLAPAFSQTASFHPCWVSRDLCKKMNHIQLLQPSCHQPIYLLYCPCDSVAQWIERTPPERKAAGSTPATVTITRNPLPRLFPFPGCSSPFSSANKLALLRLIF